MILEIEVVGAKQIKESFPQALLIFVLPPSLAELERRLRGRGTDSETVITRRIERAKEELALSHLFDQQIVNDDLDKALEEIERAIWGN